MNTARRFITAGDARTVITGIVALLVLALVVTRWTATDVRLLRVLRRLPPATRLVVLEPARAGRAVSADGPRALVTALAGVSRAQPTTAVPPVATLVLAGRTAHDVVLLFEPDRAHAAGIDGVPVGGFLAVGPADAVRLLAASPADRRVTTDAVRFLQASAETSVRLLVHPLLVAERAPLLVDLADPTDPFLALTLESVDQRLLVRGLILNSPPRPGDPRGSRLLADPPADAVLVVDGFLLRQWLPPALPPVLEALKQETGVGAELSTLLTTFGESPAALVVLPSPGSTDLVVALRRPLPGTAGDGPVRALLERRLALARAVVERVRVEGQVIRHRRTGPTKDRGRSAGGGTLQETVRDGWRVLRAPRAAEGSDLVAAFNHTTVLLGTGEEAVFAVARHLAARPLAGRVSLRVRGDRVRALPLVSAASRGLPEVLRSWLGVLRDGSLDIAFGASLIRFEGSAELSVDLFSLVPSAD